MDNQQESAQTPSTPKTSASSLDEKGEANESITPENKKEKNNDILATIATAANIIISIPFYCILLFLFVLYIKDGKIDANGCGFGLNEPYGNACNALFSYAFLMAFCLYGGMPILVLNIICEKRLRKDNVKNPKKYALARNTFYILLVGIALLFMVFLLVRPN